MTDKTAISAEQPEPEPMPHSGGSYHRQPDGTLGKNPPPKPKSKRKSPAKPAEKEA